MNRHIRITHSGKNRVIIALIVVGAFLVVGAYNHTNVPRSITQRITRLEHACVPTYTGGGVTQCLQPAITSNHIGAGFVSRHEFNVWRIAMADDVRTLNGDNNAQWNQLRAIVCHIRVIRVNTHRVMWVFDNTSKWVGICMRGDVSRSQSSLRTTG